MWYAIALTGRCWNTDFVCIFANSDTLFRFTEQWLPLNSLYLAFYYHYDVTYPLWISDGTLSLTSPLSPLLDFDLFSTSIPKNKWSKVKVHFLKLFILVMLLKSLFCQMYSNPNPTDLVHLNFWSILSSLFCSILWK